MTNQAYLLVAICLFLGGCMSLESRLQSEDYETRREAEVELYRNASEAGADLSAVVDRISCDEVLAAITLVSSTEIEVKKSALEKIQSQKLIEEIALDGCEKEIQELALTRLTDQTRLMSAYGKLKEKDLRLYAISRMNSSTATRLPIDRFVLENWHGIDNQAVIFMVIKSSLGTINEGDLDAMTAKITDPVMRKQLQMFYAQTYKEQISKQSECSSAKPKSSSSRKQKRISKANVEQKTETAAPLTAAVLEMLARHITDSEIIEKMVIKPDVNKRSEEDRQQRNAMWALQRRIEGKESEYHNQCSYAKRAEKAWHFSEAKECQQKAERCKRELEQLKLELVKVKNVSPVDVYLEDFSIRKNFYAKLNQDVIQRMLCKAEANLGEYSCPSVDDWRELNTLLSCLKEEGEKKRLYALILSYFTGHEVKIDKFAFVSEWHLEKSPSLVVELLLKDKYVMRFVEKYITSDVATNVLTRVKNIDDDGQIVLAQKIDPDAIDVKVYQMVSATGGKKILKQKMSKELLDQVSGSEKLTIESLLSKGKTAEKYTFSLNGFYLDMPIEDAKMLLEHYFPESTVTLTQNEELQIDYNPEGLHGYTPMCFCRANGGRVVLFNFDKKRFLDKWFDYDVQDADEWASAYGTAHGFSMKRKLVSEARNVKDVYMKVSQVTYSHKNNKQGYEEIVFGEKRILDVNEDTSLTTIIDNADWMGRENAMRHAGVIEGARLWANVQFDNEKGAREGTLRIQRQ